MAKIPIVTLTTDFGARDAYAAAVKGVLLSMAPRVRLVDITHEVPAHDILAASFILAQAAPYFPKDTLHMIVVDPGVGTDRRILAGRMGGQYFLAPDNGVITFLTGLYPLEEIVVVRNTQFLPPPSAIPSTFQGRDVLAPLAGHLVNGLELRQLGPRPDRFKLLALPQVRQEGGALVGQVIYVDTFGNLITNISAKMVAESWSHLDSLRVKCGGRDVGPFQGAYGFVEAGEALALFNSAGLVEVAVNLGRACDVLQAKVGAEVRIEETVRP